jgi:hypothetical protein
MCGKNKKQRHAEAAAIGTAASLTDKHGSIHTNPRHGQRQTNSIIPAIPSENPPPYSYDAGAEKPSKISKEAPINYDYHHVAEEWLSVKEEEGRKPSFNSYHSFGKHQAHLPSQYVDVPAIHSPYGRFSFDDRGGYQRC